jgi:hypothetical protein
VELAVVEVDAAFAECVEVLEDAFDAGDGFRFTHDPEAVGAEIDSDVEAVFHKTEVLIARAEERLDTGSDGKRFCRQAFG